MGLRPLAARASGPEAAILRAGWDNPDPLADPAMTITLKTPTDIDAMRVAGRLASEVLDFLTPHIKPGITTLQVDKLAHDYMVNVQGTVPATLNYAPAGYPPYPASLCTSVNHEVCHGIPAERPLKNVRHASWL